MLKIKKWLTATMIALFLVVAFAPIAMAQDDGGTATVSADAGVAAPGRVITVPDIDKDPAGFFKTLYKLATDKDWFPLFSLAIVGVVWLSRRKFILDKFPIMKNAWVARTQVVLTALSAAIITALAAGKPMKAAILFALMQAGAGAFGYDFVRNKEGK